MMVAPLVPAAGLERAARGVLLRDPLSIQWISPGADLSRIDRVASGVTSRGPNPVPPNR